MEGKKLAGLLIGGAGLLGVVMQFHTQQPQATNPEFVTGRQVNQHFVDTNRWDAIRADGCEMLAKRGESLGVETIALMMQRQIKTTDSAAKEAAIELAETCQRGDGWMGQATQQATPTPPPAPAPAIVVVNSATPTPKYDPRPSHPEIYYGSQPPVLPKAFGTAAMIKPEWKLITAKDAANCRVMPSLDHEVATTIEPGAKVLVNASAKGFFFNAVNRCWIHASQF